VNFLIDAQLPPVLARWITSQGHDAVHVFDLGLQAADDPLIWERARSQDAVIISKDEDFVDRWLLSDPLCPWFRFEGGIARTVRCSHGSSLCGWTP